MRKPSFVTLAQLDDTRFITACRHGLIHLTWTRSTVRFSSDEFRRLATLLCQVAGASPPAAARDGDLQVSWHLDDNCALEVGPLSLLLSTGELEDLARAARDAVERLDKILDSGVWDEEEADPPAGAHPFRRFPFSTN